MASTAENTGRQRQQDWSRCSPVREKLGLVSRGACSCNLSRIVLDLKFMLRLPQHLTTAEGRVGFPGVLERHKRAHGEGHGNNQEYPG
jgi:hypothetical protein